jgi:Tfp pilus assembly protein PilV
VRRGFTLIEAALATIIVGVGCIAVMQLALACTEQNRFATQTTSATLLAGNLRELLSKLPFNDPTSGPATFGAETGETIATFDDIDDFNDRTFSPPIDVNRATIAGMTGYSQVVSVRTVPGNSLSANQTTASSTYTGALRVTITINYTAPGSTLGVPVHEISWLRVEE